MKLQLNKKPDSYQTDEDELQEEVGRFEKQTQNFVEDENKNAKPDNEWQKITHKKRKQESPQSGKNKKKQATGNNYWLSKTPKNTNQFAVLDSENEPLPSSNPPEKVFKPPPIFVDKVSNIQPLIALLSETVPNEYEIKTLRKQQVKIQPKTHETYKRIVSELEQKNTEFYTYKPKCERGFKVIMRNMHPSIDTQCLKNELSRLGHEVTNIWNIKSRYKKEPLPLFELVLVSKPNNKDIYSITKLMSNIIKFEPPRPKKIIPQCTNCQQHGHTKAYCRKKPICVKCAGPHESRSCPKKHWANEVKCALCNGNHPANYKGCSVYKQIYTHHYPSLRKTINEQLEPQHPSTSAERRENVQYSSVARNAIQNHQIPIGTQPQNQQTTSNKLPEIHEMLSGLNILMKQMSNLLTSISEKLSHI